MGYLENFARNRRTREKTEVLTARLPEGLYKDFKGYCDEIGLSISEAVYLLVQREMDSLEREATTEEIQPTTDEYKPTANVAKPTTRRIGTTTARFTTKQWQVNGELPCPKCGEWVSASNFARHAKQHGSNTHTMFTDETNLIKVEEMIKDRIK